VTQLAKRHGFAFDQLPVFLWALLIFIASSIPNVTLPDLKFVPSDKAVHLLIYLIFCALLHRALVFQSRFPFLARWSLMWCLVLTIAYGASDEFHQSFVPNRDASVYDLMADALGALLFVSFVLIRNRVKTKAGK
jgi:hypothetical protein